MGRVWLTDAEGIRNQWYVYGKTKTQVTDKMRSLRLQETEQSLVAPDRMQLSAFLTQWVRDVIVPTKRLGTAMSYESVCRNHLVPMLGSRPVQKLTAAEIQKEFATLKAGDRTKELAFVVLRAALRQALAWGIVARNVTDAVVRPKNPRTEMKVLNPEQVLRLLTHSKTDRLYALYRLALATGMRQGELFALRWADIDFQRNTITVQNQLSQHTLKPEEVKTDRSRRSIDITPQVATDLRLHRDRQFAEMGKQHFVFLSPDGSMLRISNFTRREWKPLLKRARLPDIRFHDLRHTAATLMLLAGVNVKVISERLGHSKVAFTMDTYTHVFPNMRREAASAVEPFFSDKALSS